MEVNDENNTDENSAGNDANFFENYKKILKTYIDQKIELAKLTVIEKTAVVSAMLFSSFLIAFFALIFMLFLSVTAGLLIGKYMNSLIGGFAVVAGFYLLLTVLLILNRKNIEKPVVNLLVKLMVNDIK